LPQQSWAAYCLDRACSRGSEFLILGVRLIKRRRLSSNLTKRESVGVGMRIVLGTIGLIIAATPALAIPGPAAPAGLLASGIPAAAIVGAVLLGGRLFKRK